MCSQGADPESMKAAAKEYLLSCSVADAISRLSETSLPRSEQQEIFEKYHGAQSHSNLSDFLLSRRVGNEAREQQLYQVTTNARLLTQSGQADLANHLEMDISVLNLQQFEKEMQFEKELKLFMHGCSVEGRERMLLVQSNIDCEESYRLIECVRYSAATRHFFCLDLPFFALLTYLSCRNLRQIMNLRIADLSKACKNGRVG